MSISLHNCWTCGASLLDLDRPTDSFFWCSSACESTYEDKIRADMAASEARAAEAEHEAPSAEATAKLGPTGANTSRASKVAFATHPGRKGTKKTCGRCGDKGHNARTCKGRAKASAAKSLTEKAPKVVSTKPGTTSVKGSIKVSGRGGPGKQKTCGKCGGKGHNARTCGKG